MVEAFDSVCLLTSFFLLIVGIVLKPLDFSPHFRPLMFHDFNLFVDCFESEPLVAELMGSHFVVFFEFVSFADFLIVCASCSA